ncbi:fam-m protein [Plasmodium malariae]|uniref:Fam-m protein n=1 Tax=Plasmodium malariae TaxID=5858 RepID=A0A1D3JK93_PLAMA|nr:fam-m protein [Plasmodium malariae]SBT86815.1 fam-m protein [Plasmodium malariae]
MEQNIILLFLIKFSMFLFLIWIYHFYNDMAEFNKYLGKKFKFHRELDKRNYRLLSKNKKNKNSNIVPLYEDMTNNRECKKNDTYISEKVFPKGMKQFNRCTLNKDKYYTEVTDYDNGIFDGKYFHFEKKLIKKKDYDNFLERNKRISDILLKKIKFRSYGFGVVTFILFFLSGITLPIIKGVGYLNTVNEKLMELIKLIAGEVNALKPYIGVITFGVFIIITGIIFLIIIYKILCNNEKYKKIKSMSE